MKLLSITVPCYNSQEYMAKCIDSLLPGGDRVEIIIVDDGSADDTGAIADAYAAKYPHIVRVVHQENGGHGEGINVGIKLATGKYFKVVDSDDWLSRDFVSFLDKLEQLDTDLVVTNYYYQHSDGKQDRSIRYHNVFPIHSIFTWEDTKRFSMHQLLTIHSCTFRTEIMKKWTHPLPKHVFYEDNLMVYQSLPYVHRLYYLDMDLYRYWIGRPDQSVQKNVMMKRYMHQILVTELCFTACHLDDIPSKGLRHYLRHELFLMFGIAISYCRLHRSCEADANMERMFQKCRQFDEKWADYFRKRSALRWMCLPGRLGQNFAAFIYWFTNTFVVRFN